MTCLRRHNWPAFLLLLMSCPALNGQVVDGHFKLDKADYLVDEPIFVIFEIVNEGSQPIEIFHASPYGCQGYEFHVDPPGHNWLSCRNVVGSCPGGARLIQPGEKFQERILIQYWMRLSQPGVYEVSALGLIHAIPSLTDLTVPRERPTRVRGNLTLSIHAPESPQQLQAIYQPILASLHSKEEEKWVDAARIITEVAPPFLQSTILEMASDSTRQYFVVNGLRKLNTPETRSVLADWACGFRNTYSATQDIALRYLGESGDRSYMSRVLRMANQADSSYLQGQALNAYAELGRDDAVPHLLRLLKTSDFDGQVNALWALSSTGSRDAVPKIIEMIRADGLRDVALGALQVLTHKRLKNAGGPKIAYQIWRDWWKAHGQQSEVFGPDQCVEPTVIDGPP